MSEACAAARERLSQVFRRWPEVLAVYPCDTSAATVQGDGRIAIVPRHGGLRRHRLGLLQALEGDGFHDLDLVFLERADQVLRFLREPHPPAIFEAEDFAPGPFIASLERQVAALGAQAVATAAG